MKKSLLLSLIAGLIATGVYLPAKLKRDAPAMAAESREPRRVSVAAAKSRGDRAEPRAQTDPARLADAAAVIEEAAITYSPAGVRAIRPYLQDPDPAIRRAARDGLVQLGEADAVPFLREAALQAADPEEIASLREAADLLALPAWSDSEEARDAVAEILESQSP